MQALILIPDSGIHMRQAYETLCTAQNNSFEEYTRQVQITFPDIAR